MGILRFPPPEDKGARLNSVVDGPHPVVPVLMSQVLMRMIVLRTVVLPPMSQKRTIGL